MAYPLRTVDATPESSLEAQAEPPSRPATVPAAGVWNAQDNKWEVSRKDDQGARDGECIFYRDDGTLFSRVRFNAGVQEGPFVVYPPERRRRPRGHVRIRAPRRGRDRVRVGAARR